MKLNVASIDVQDQAERPDGDLSRKSPVAPAAAMEQMAHDRLVAAGPSGTAVFTVSQASITRNDNGGLTEQLTAHLDIDGADGSHAGYAEAHVSRSMTTPDGPGPALYYELTRQAMQDMNVEFEYQVRHSLKDWLVDPGAPEGDVKAVPLPGGAAAPVQPGGSSPIDLQPMQGAGPAAAPNPPALPGAAAPAQPSQVMSPQPGFLVPPASPATPPGTGEFVPPAASPSTGGY